MRRCGNATLEALPSVSHTHSTTTCTFFFVAALLIYSIARSPALVPSSFFFASASTDKYIIIQRSACIWSSVINSWCPAVFLSIPDIVSVFLSLFLWRRWHGFGFKNIPASQMEAGGVLQLQYDSIWHVSLCYCLRRFEVLSFFHCYIHTYRIKHKISKFEAFDLPSKTKCCI